MSHPGPRQPAFTVLLLGSANISRSAFAECLGRAYLREQLGAGAPGICLVSAGTRAVVGSAMHEDSASALRGFGADPEDFRARDLEDGLALDADLILTMTWRLWREVVHELPDAMARSFTLRQAAAVVPLVGDSQIAGRDLVERARSFVAALAAARAGRRSGEEEDDVFDPIGLPPEAHEEMGEMVTEALLPVLHRLVRLSSHTSALGD